MTDQVCAWAAASPARYRASSSSKAASMSSGSNATTAATVVGVDLYELKSVSVESSGPLAAVRVRQREARRIVASATAVNAIVNPGRRLSASSDRRISPCRVPAPTTGRRSSME